MVCRSEAGALSHQGIELRFTTTENGTAAGADGAALGSGGQDDFERIAATSPDIIFIYDCQDDRLVYCNEKYREMYGLPADLMVPGVIPKLSDTPGSFAGGGPRLGQHTEEVLRQLGIDAQRMESLREKGVV